MHFKSGSLQSVRIMPPLLAESYYFISSIVSSSIGDPTFPDSLFLVTDSSLFSLPKIGSNSSYNPHPYPSPSSTLPEPSSIPGSAFPNNRSMLPGNWFALPRTGFSIPELGSIFPGSNFVLPDSSSIFFYNRSMFPGNRFVLPIISFSLPRRWSDSSSISFPLLLNAYLCSTKLTDTTQKTPWLTM
jgi:hypothetical protein